MLNSKNDALTLIWMTIKRVRSCVTGLIYDSQATNRKQVGLSVRAPLPHHTPIGWNTQKYHHN